MNIRAKKSAGFTIIELLMASAVFSLVLMTALVGFLQIGRLFYKGVTANQDNTVSRQIIDDITTGIRTAANVTPPTKGNGYDYFCISGMRYTFNKGQEVDLSAKQNLSNKGNFGLLKDDLGSSTACAAPCDPANPPTCLSGAVALNKPVELLANKMRLADFSLKASSTDTNLYNLSLVTALGDNEVLDLSTPTNPSCKGNSQTSQFCAVDHFSTTVYRGINP